MMGSSFDVMFNVNWIPESLSIIASPAVIQKSIEKQPENVIALPSPLPHPSTHPAPQCNDLCFLHSRAD